MQKVKEMVLTPEFIFVTIFLSLALNVVASYLKDWIDARRAAMSAARRAKLEKASEARQARVMTLANNAEFMAEMRHREVRERCYVILVAVAVIVLYQVLPISLSFFWPQWMSAIVLLLPMLVATTFLIAGIRTARSLANDLDDAADIRQSHKLTG